MSLKDPDLRRQGYGLPSSVQHRLVVITGFPEGHLADQGRVYDEPAYSHEESTCHFLRKLRDERGLPNAYVLHGTVDQDMVRDSSGQYDHGAATLNNVWQYIKGLRSPSVDGPSAAIPGGYFDPRGKIIIYGFSAGGFNAVYACRGIGNWWYRYGTDERQRGILQHISNAPFDPRQGARVQVDLLVTVDPCASLGYDEAWDTSVHECVRWCQNWYQRSECETFKGMNLSGSRVRSTEIKPEHIRPNVGREDQAQFEFRMRNGVKCPNPYLPQHFSMAEYTVDWVIDLIKREMRRT